MDVCFRHKGSRGWLVSRLISWVSLGDAEPGKAIARMNNLLDYKFLVPVVLLLGLAPFIPQPHIIEKLRMLSAGTLKSPIDIFDLVWHGWPFVLLAYRVSRDISHYIK